MKLSRRDFLVNSVGVAGAALAGGWAGARPAAVLPRSRGVLECALVEGGCRGALKESARGYEAVLSDIGKRYRPVSLDALPEARRLILPGVVRLEDQPTRALLENVRRGATVVLESGGGFAEAGDYRAHQRWLEEFFGVRVEAPVDLWSGITPRGRVPYVDYSWPRPLMVRDFSRVVPVASASGEVIATVEGLPVGVRRAMGRGTLVFLGSPLGPALDAGDREARTWLREFLATS